MSTMAATRGGDVSTYDKKNILYHDSRGKILPNRLKADPLITYSPNPTIIIDKKRSIVAWNPSMETLTCIAAGEMLGCTTDRYALKIYESQRPTLADLVVTPDSEIENKLGIERHGSMVEEELVFREGSSGVEKTVLVKAGPIHDRDGSIIGAIETLQDITKYRSAERISQQSEEKYRQLIKTSVQFIIVCDLEGNITFADETALTIGGYSEEDSLKLNITDILPDDQISKPRELIARRKAGDKGIYCYNIDLINKKGERIPLRVRSSLIVENDRPMGILLTGLDLRNHRRIEEKLRQSEARFRAIFDTAQDYIVIKDCDLRYVDVNPQVERLFGMPAQKLIGWTDRDLFDEEISDHEKIIDFRVLKGEIVEEEQTRTLAGVPISFHIIKVPLRDADGRITGICGISRDITKRKAVEETLRESEERYRTFINSTSDMVFMKDEHFRYTIVNTTLSTFFGEGEDAIIGKTDFDLLPKTAAVPCRKTDMASLENNGPVVAEERGAGRIFETVKFPVRLNNHKIGVGGFIRDITNKKLIEEALREREEKYRLITENVSDIVWTMDRDQRFTFVSPSVERILGYAVDEVMAGGLIQVVTPESHDRAVRIIRERIADDKEEAGSMPDPVTLELEHICKDGSIIIGEVTYLSLRDEQNRVTGLIGVTRDISKRKQSEEALRESETKYRHLVENIRDVIFSVNQSGVVMYVSPAIEPLMGYTPEEIVGLHFGEFVHRDDHQRLLKYFDKMRSGIPQGVGNEYRLVTRYGNIRWVCFSIRSIHENDVIVGFSGTIFDMTERKVKEKALQEQEELYRTLTENVNDGVVLAVDQTILFANGSFTAMMDCSDVKELIGRSVHEFVRDDYQGKLQSLLNELETGQCARNRFRGSCITKSGKEIWVDTYHNRIQWNGQSAVLATIRDITEDRGRILAMKAETKTLKQENVRLRSFMKGRYRLDDIIGKSPAMQNIYEFIYRAAESDSPVIIYGESGTGKELVARAIHKMSARRNGVVIPVNCGAIPENLLESEFFGHKKGAFTGATVNKSGYLDITDGGSLFLDEIGEISLAMQVKLLRAIEGNGYSPLGSNEIKKSNVRIIAATNKRLIDLIKRGSMREDFFYRIHILPITLPPLRKRKEDIPLLVEHFMKIYGYDKRAHAIPCKVMDELCRYDWPGNVRELENVLNRYITFKQLDFIDVTSEPARDRQHMSADTLETVDETDANDVMNVPGKEVILKVLHKNQWHRSRAASELGISRNTLYRKMKQCGINHW